MKFSKQSGFTLVEILVVISIISLLFIVFLPAIDNAFIKANETGVKTNFRDFQIATEALLTDSNGKYLDIESLNVYLDNSHETKIDGTFIVTKSEDAWGNPYLVEIGDRKIMFYSNGKSGKKSEKAYVLVTYYYKGVVSSCTSGFPTNNLALNLPNMDMRFYCGADLPSREGGEGGEEHSPGDMTLDPPVNFTATNILETSAKLSWNRVSRATQYVLKRNDTTIYIGSNTSFTDTSLTLNTTYSYSLIAKNGGNMSIPSALSVATDSGQPRTPTNFVARNIAPTSIQLAWDVVSNAQRYALYRNGTLIYEGSENLYEVRTLTPYTTYYYEVVAINAKGVSPRAFINVKTTASYETVKLPDEGSGSCEPYDPYIITTVGELQGMNIEKDACYKLGDDIDASYTRNWNNGAGFASIGSHTAYQTSGFGFSDGVRTELGLWGDFDGAEYTISDLYINRPTAHGVGLFVAFMGEVKNVKILNAHIIGYKDVGVLVGGTPNGSSASNIEVSGYVEGTLVSGGLMGYNAGHLDGIIVYADVYNKTTGSTGGVIGESDFNATLSHVVYTGEVRANYSVGGLVGWNKSVITNGTVNATIRLSNGSTAGGVIGSNANKVSRITSNSVITGTGTVVGGIVGGNNGVGAFTDIINNSQNLVTGTRIGPFYGN